MNEKPKIVQNDPWLEPFIDIIKARTKAYEKLHNRFTQNAGSLKNFASGFLYYGMHKTQSGWVFREWSPNAFDIYLIGDFNNWQRESKYKMQRLLHGNWEIVLGENDIKEGDKFKLLVIWKGGEGERLPSYAVQCLQNSETKHFDAVVRPIRAYKWKNESPACSIKQPLIYEAHVGMGTDKERVGTFKEFKENILPRIKRNGYNTVQLMAVQEHPYYGSFGYHVSNFFSVSSRFGSPEDLKELIDEAHGLGLAVIMDIVHSHSVKNELEGLAQFDGRPDLYFHGNDRREHVAWDSLCFDYGKDQVIHFLLSNCRYWLEEYNFDGFRFDGVTSMIYVDHGLSRDFTSYEFYYDGNQDADAINYLTLANALIHEVNPCAITIAEEMSGMPGLADKIENGGYGFDYRMSMGIPDYWIKIIKEVADENWDIAQMYHELTSRRNTEKTINYCESHDQALVGDKTIIFRLIDKEMYWHMHKASKNLIVDRGIALHKMIRLATFATNGGGYLNFMGNEFGHPEWVDFPREGNGESYKYARRQWGLESNKELKYHQLGDFDREMLLLQEKYDFLKDPWCYKYVDNTGDQVLAFERGMLLFIFNFNPSKSFTDYGIKVHAGKYQLLLNTDSECFGGFGNIDESVQYITQRIGGVGGEDWFKVYLPSRTAIVLKRKQTPKVY